MNNYKFRYIQLWISCFIAIALLACSTQKEGSTAKGFQNLTARYNYIYNANILLKEYVSALHTSYADNYNDILPVYLSPYETDAAIPQQNDHKTLEEIINKSKTIISDKSQSNYVDDAYLLMGKSEFYKGNFFLATEYFSYVSNAYQKDKSSRVDALNWQARSYLQLQDLKKAGQCLDILEKELDSVKDNRDAAHATMAQMALAIKDPKSAISYLFEALKDNPDKLDALRWHFILGQLFDQQKDFKQALYHYGKVRNSNANFELYFNAMLKQVKLNAQIDGDKINREEQLLGLLKDEKNLDFSDQIYFQAAEYFRQQQEFPKAITYYNTAIATGKNNKYLKGLIYLQLAEINFQHLRNYLQAKKYYDSTLTNLPIAYPSYNLILRKNQNLEYLSSRYELISAQDTLQTLARLPEAERLAKIQALLFSKPDTTVAIQTSTTPITRNGTFYFNNTYAMERGAADFLKRWGNRKLEDNWRQSIRRNTSNTQLPISADSYAARLSDMGDRQNDTDSSKLAIYIQTIPLTPQQLLASNQIIVNAWYELANFYQQELNDQQEAASIFEYLLKNYPENNQLAAINYGLYLIYKDADPTKAEALKLKVLREYGSSIYARTLLDPNYSSNLNNKNLAFNDVYSDTFNQYLNKNFSQVIQIADRELKQNTQHPFASQFAYLKAIAVGRTQPVDSLLKEFKFIKQQFPSDLLIVPLIDDHLKYINAHLAEFKKRKIALVDFDPNEPRFIAQQTITPSIKPAQVAQVAPESIIKVSPNVDAKVNVPAMVQPANAPAITNLESPFKKTASSEWYFIIDVSDASIRLTSSRFGLGQFNRGNYPGVDLRHQLTEFDNEQLIYVGNFSSFEAVKAYQDRIVPQLNRIMRVRPGIYKAFIISKDHFELIKNKVILDQYLEFYKNNY